MEGLYIRVVIQLVCIVLRYRTVGIEPQERLTLTYMLGQGTIYVINLAYRKVEQVICLIVRALGIGYIPIIVRILTRFVGNEVQTVPLDLLALTMYLIFCIRLGHRLDREVQHVGRVAARDRRMGIGIITGYGKQLSVPQIWQLARTSSIRLLIPERLNHMYRDGECRVAAVNCLRID